MRRPGSTPWGAAFDLAIVLAMMFLILALTERPATPPAVPTIGFFAVTSTWRAGSQDDVDLYVRDPSGNIAYFNAMSVGLMHLEQDDLGALPECSSNTKCLARPNQERTIIRGIVPGEYVVDVHLYAKSDPAPIQTTVALWSLQGSAPITTATVTLPEQGKVGTAFRFTLDAAGHVTNINHLPVDIVDAAGTPSSGMVGHL